MAGRCAAQGVVAEVAALLAADEAARAARRMDRRAAARRDRAPTRADAGPTAEYGARASGGDTHGWDRPPGMVAADRHGEDREMRSPLPYP